MDSVMKKPSYSKKLTPTTKDNILSPGRNNNEKNKPNYSRPDIKSSTNGIPLRKKV